jgi:tight adherence protein B
MSPATMNALLGALAGAGLVAGLVLIALALTDRRPSTPRPSRLPTVLRRSEASWRHRALRRIRYGAAPVAGLLVWLLSGWPVAGLIVAAAILALPALFGATGHARRALERLEALESWTRHLADLRSAGGGLEQTLSASLKTCPDPVRPEVGALVARLRAGWRAEPALRAFADDLAEPAGDLVVAVLLLESERRGTGVARVLDDLAVTVAEEVAMRRKVEADRAKPRTSARIVTALTLLTVAIGAVNHTYIQPYGTPLGQLVLLLLGAAVAGCLWWMRHLTRGRPDTRVLAGGPGPREDVERREGWMSR